MREGWKGMKIADICEKASSNIALNKIQDIDGDYPIYGASGYIKNVDFYHRDKAYIGVVKDGSGVGRVNTYPPMTSLLGTMQYILPKDGYCLGYVAYALKSLNLASFASGAAIPHIYFRDYGQCEICVPSIQEQERIVAELDLLTGIIDKQKQQLKELDNLAQSIFYDMFGSVDNNTKNFMVKCLNEVFQLITDGTHQTPQYTDDILHGFKFLSAKDVVSGVIDWTRIKYIPESLHNELYKRLAPRRGDILLCKNGTTGICALVETDEVFDIYVSLALLRTEKEYNKKYLVYAINNPSTKSQFDDSLKGVGVPNLHLGEIKKTKILVPPIELQSSFAKKIESIESQKEFINRSIAESQKLFDYTMDKYFG